MKQGPCAAVCDKTVLSVSGLISTHTGSQAVERHTGTMRHPVLIHLMPRVLPVRAVIEDLSGQNMSLSRTLLI